MGHFDTRHIAHLSFTLHNPANQAMLQLEGILDTGFTGFIQIPLGFGSALGLLTPKMPVGESILANGAKQPLLLAKTKVTVHKETQSGYCQMPLAATCPILIGMDFLRRFDRMLIVSSKLGIHLVPEQPAQS